MKLPNLMNLARDGYHTCPGCHNIVEPVVDDSNGGIPRCPICRRAPLRWHDPVPCFETTAAAGRVVKVLCQLRFAPDTEMDKERLRLLITAAVEGALVNRRAALRGLPGATDPIPTVDVIIDA